MLKLVSALLVLATPAFSQCTGVCRPSDNVSATIITPSGTKSLDPGEADSLDKARGLISSLEAKLAEARAALQTLQTSLSLTYGADSTKPSQITLEHSTVLAYVPPTPVWSKVAVDGQTVLIAKGSTIRYGTVAGALPAYPPGSTTPLAADAFVIVTVTADTTLILGNAASLTAAGIITDPAFGYLKELDIQQGTGTVTVQ